MNSYKEAEKTEAPGKNPVLSVVIPVYNEERTIRALLEKVDAVRIPGHPLEIIVVNDGSTDESPALIHRWAAGRDRSSGNTVLLLDKENGGKGSAVRMGIRHSTGGVLIVQDADLEYDPEDYEACAGPIFRGECKVVYGTREDANRNRIYSSPGFYLGALSLTFWINLLFNANLTDEATCYKTFDGDLIRSILFEGNHFEWEPELTAKILRLGYEIRETPIRYYPRKTSEGKKIRFRDGIQGFAVAFRWRFASIKREKELLSAASEEDACHIRQVRYAQTALLAVTLIAVLIRLLYALPGICDPQLLMRPDSPTYLGPAFSLLSDGVFASSPGASPTAFRTPLYPLYLAFCLLISGKSLGFCAAVSAVLGGLIAAPVYLAARLFGGWKSAFFAALLFALNPTAIALSPMFLSDTLFLFLFSVQMLFFLKFIRCRFALFFFVSVFMAALAALVRPINLLWILPCLFVLWLVPALPAYLKGYYSFFALLIYAAVLCPWMIRNDLAAKAGFRLDLVQSQSLMHNTAALESRITGVPAETLREKYRAEFAQVYEAEPDRYATPGKQADYEEAFLTKKIMKHPVRYFLLHIRPYVLLPDLSSFLENLGLTTTERGTFDVLNRQGVLAAARHYFRGQERLLFLCAPLLLAVLITYVAAFLGLAQEILLKKNWMLLLLALLLAEYYLFLPGPVCMPRYQLPAVLFLCVIAGGALFRMSQWIRKCREKGSADHGNGD